MAASDTTRADLAKLLAERAAVDLEIARLHALPTTVRKPHLQTAPKPKPALCKPAAMSAARHAPLTKPALAVGPTPPRKPRTVPWAEQPAAVPPGLQVQHCPSSRDTRYSVTGPVVGGFATLGIGRYLPNPEKEPSA